jgi:hypothetical protein
MGLATLGDAPLQLRRHTLAAPATPLVASPPWQRRATALAAAPPCHGSRASEPWQHLRPLVAAASSLAASPPPTATSKQLAAPPTAAPRSTITAPSPPILQHLQQIHGDHGRCARQARDASEVGIGAHMAEVERSAPAVRGSGQGDSRGRGGGRIRRGLGGAGIQ